MLDHPWYQFALRKPVPPLLRIAYIDYDSLDTEPFVSCGHQIWWGRI